jgi:hypothetical protein
MYEISIRPKRSYYIDMNIVGSLRVKRLTRESYALRIINDTKYVIRKAYDKNKEVFILIQARGIQILSHD